MPGSMSIERRRLMMAYGAELIVTEAKLGFPGANKARDEVLAKLGDRAWFADQFANPANIEVHLQTTINEIRAAFPDGLDYIVGGVGTGGHITACAEGLKQHWPGLKVLAVQPATAPVLTGGKMQPHRIQGIMPGFVPANFHGEHVDEILSVTNEDAMLLTWRVAREEGLLVGISSGAVLAAVAQVLERAPDARILAFTYDTGERYVSIHDLWAIGNSSVVPREPSVLPITTVETVEPIPAPPAVVPAPAPAPVSS
eukprot:TRINITY_DN1324_c0_g1_i6.p1 TRINITY_DN1324_c0_g1~~TRINITY_DN1324_c0_g1_i6.p1  ORF type:complete len:256 (-),score=72.63 TRINITY_DN1324_c0_g1_i6:237-1004(-)